MGTFFVEKTAFETAEGIVQDLLRDAEGRAFSEGSREEILFHKKIQKLHRYDAAAVLYPEPHTEIAGVVEQSKNSC